MFSDAIPAEISIVPGIWYGTGLALGTCRKIQRAQTKLFV